MPKKEQEHREGVHIIDKNKDEVPEGGDTLEIYTVSGIDVDMILQKVLAMKM